MIQTCRVLLLFLVWAALSGCGIIGEAVRDSAEEHASLPVGSVVAGDGFSVRSPVAGLLVVRDQPRRGFLSLRSSSRDMFLHIGGTYNVYPFVLGSPAPTLRDAWSAHALSEFSASGRAAYHIKTEHTGTWRGQPAYYQTAYSEQSPDGGGIIASSCLIQHGTKYYWIVRSRPVRSNQPESILHHVAEWTDRELLPFLNSLAFSDTPSA